MGDPPIIHYGNSLPPSFSIFGVANQRRDDQPRGFFGRIIRDIAGDSPRYMPPLPPVLPKPPTPIPPPAAVPAPAPIPAPAIIPAPLPIPAPAIIPAPLPIPASAVVVPAGVEPKKTMAQIQVWEWQPHATVEMQIAEVSPHPPLVADPPAPKPNNKIVCPVCMEREPCVVLIPCGHNGYCMSCVANLAACPACRAVVRERIRTYSVAIPDE